MADDKRGASRHSITIDRRENIMIAGVLDVISFDEETIIADTDMGVLILHGSNFHVSRLNLENGELDIDGEITNLNYEEQNNFAKGKSSFLGKLFK